MCVYDFVGVCECECVRVCMFVHVYVYVGMYLCVCVCEVNDTFISRLRIYTVMPKTLSAFLLLDWLSGRFLPKMGISLRSSWS